MTIHNVYFEQSLYELRKAKYATVDIYIRLHTYMYNACFVIKIALLSFLRVCLIIFQ